MEKFGGRKRMPAFKQILYVFGCALLPVIELRGAIPLAASLDFPWYLAYAVSVIGNFLPVPFILLFIRQILHWMKRFRYTQRIALWIEKKAQHNTAKVMKYASVGLLLFVAIPLPGTGAWTGALVAAVMDMRMQYALPSIFAGVLMAGVVVTGISYGVLGFLSFLV